jgi:alginate O-acetyltransferase complex protein AlgJ
MPVADLDGKVIEGKNGWLFLANDRNGVLSQHSGERPFSQRALERWQRLLEERQAWVEAEGASYFFLVPPNAHSVYPEHLPDVVANGERPVQQLLGRLQAEKSPASIIYPLAALSKEKKRHLVYSPTDSHWNAAGAFAAYLRTATEIGKVFPLRQLKRDEIAFAERVVVGDLGSKLQPVRSGIQVTAEVKDPQSVLVSDNRVRNRGRIIEFACDKAEGTCLILGDSFTFAALRFFAESFRKLVFAQIVTLDRELVREQRPDVVLTVMNERFVRAIPDDAGAPSAREYEAERVRNGEVMSEKSVNGLAKKLLWP